MVRLMEGEQECNNRTQTVQWGGRQDKSRDGAQVARPCGTMGCCASRAAAGMAHFAISQMISILKAPALILAGRMSRG
jgi:hypothetical protein